MSFITKFRPTNFDEIVGHEKELKVLKSRLRSADRPHSFLLSGNSGLGKTTIARVIGKNTLSKIIEFDAGKITGVDSIRELLEETKYVSIGVSTNKCFIIDECHMLSKSAWNALLKVVEEPPKHVYFVFCTTEANKVPKTIQGRCLHVSLKPLTPNKICDVVELTDEKVGKEYIDLISKNCEGSPRNALSLLEKAVEIGSINEFKKLLNQDNSIELNVLNICRQLVKSKPNQDDILKNLKEINNYEGARIQIFNYLTSVCLTNNSLFTKLVCFEDSIKSETTGKGELLIKILTALEE